MKTKAITEKVTLFERIDLKDSSLTKKESDLNIYDFTVLSLKYFDKSDLILYRNGDYVKIIHSRYF